MESHPLPQSPQFVTLAELALRTGILTLKVLIPMLWLQSKVSPTQFLIGSAALVLVAFFLDLSPPQGAAPPRQAQHRRNGVIASSELDVPD